MKRRLEIDALFQTGQRLQGSHCTLVWQPAESFGFGVFVSRHMGSAVRRNRIKRLFREAIRLGQNNLTEPGRVAIIPRLRDQLPTFEEITTDVFKVLARCKS